MGVKNLNLLRLMCNSKQRKQNQILINLLGKICRVYLRLAFDTDYVKPDPPEDVDRSKVISGTGPGNFERESNGVINKSKMLGNKRKVHEAPCNLLAHDDQSRARVEELKDSLGKEA
ncbi:hypothetical protein RYX36_035684, partial [Vicia faba]